MLSIRRAKIEDAPLLCALIRELADFEHELHNVVASESDLRRDGFGADPKFRSLIAEWDGQTAGYALFCGAYSTWEGRPGLFLEDLFVRPQFRGQGIGKALLASVAQLAQRENCYGVRWEVLDWNEDAIRFYQSLGAIFRNSWKNVLLEGEALNHLGATAITQ